MLPVMMARLGAEQDAARQTNETVWLAIFLRVGGACLHEQTSPWFSKATCRAIIGPVWPGERMTQDPTESVSGRL